MALKLRNRTRNTIGLATRTVGNVGYGSLDLARSGFNYPKEIFEVLWDTTKHTKEVFRKAFNEGKWYQKIINGIASPFVAAGTIGEGAIRAVLNPTWNLFCNTRDVAGNLLVNEGNTIKWTAHEDDPKNFKYEHLGERGVSKKNQISKRQRLSKGNEKKEEKSEKKEWSEKPEEKKEDGTAKALAKIQETQQALVESLKTVTWQLDAANKKLIGLEEWKKKIDEEQKKGKVAA